MLRGLLSTNTETNPWACRLKWMGLHHVEHHRKLHEDILTFSVFIQCIQCTFSIWCLFRFHQPTGKCTHDEILTITESNYQWWLTEHPLCSTCGAVLSLRVNTELRLKPVKEGWMARFLHCTVTLCSARWLVIWSIFNWTVLMSYENWNKREQLEFNSRNTSK